MLRMNYLVRFVKKVKKLMRYDVCSKIREIIASEIMSLNSFRRKIAFYALSLKEKTREIAFSFVHVQFT